MKKETPEKETSLTKFTGLCVLAAVVIVAVIIVFLAVRNNSEISNVTAEKTNETSEPLTKYTVTQEQDETTRNKTIIFTDENGESYTAEGSDYMADLAEDRFIIIDDGRLSFFANGEELDIARNVISCSISNDGSLVAFVTPNSEDTLYIGSLFAYNTATKNWTTVCQDVFVSTAGTIQISPSGDTVAYVRNYDEDSLTYDCCYYNFNEGKETVIGQNRDVWAISDNADYIYYGVENAESYSSIFCVYTEDKGEVVLDEEGYNSFYLNLDYSECVYTKAREEEPLYISREGSEGELYLEKAEDFDTSSLVEHVNKVINADNFD